MSPEYYSSPCPMMQCYNTRRPKLYPTQQPLQPINSSTNTPTQVPKTPGPTTPNTQQPPMIPISMDLGIGYTQGYLKTQIGKRMRITFLIGTNIIQDRQGTLEQVGISYVIIKDTDAPTSTLCDIYSIKFVTIFP